MRFRPKRHFHHAAILTIILPGIAYADAGTPLMWLGMLHLAFGNFFIGIAEGILIAWWFRAKILRSIGWMVLANYSSAVLGVGLYWFTNTQITDFSANRWVFYHIRPFLILFAILTYGLSVISEWPFCHKILKPMGTSWQRSLKASLIAQTFSYLLLLPLYLLSSSYTFARQVSFVPAADIAHKTRVEIYYLSGDGKRLEAIDISGNSRRTVMESGGPYSYASLFLRAGKENGSVDLWCSYYQSRKEGLKEMLLLRDVDQRGSLTWRRRVSLMLEKDKQCLEKKVSSSENCRALAWPFNQGIQLSELEGWKIKYIGSWAIEGITLTNLQNNKDIHLSLETPFLMWGIRNVYVIPHNQVLMQLGNQIALLDLNEHKLAYLAAGTSPVVILE